MPLRPGPGLQAHRRRRHRPQHRRHGRLRPDARRRRRARSTRIMDSAVLPLVAELRRRGIDYRGVLYAGLMLTEDGPRVIEYNVRFGDPEAQVVLPAAGVGRGRAVPRRRQRGRWRLPAPGVLGRRRGLRGDGVAGLSRAPAHGRRHRGPDALGPVRGRRRGRDRLPRRDPPPRPRRPLPHRRGARARRHRGRARRSSEAAPRAYAAAAPIEWEGMQMRHDIAAAAAGWPRPAGHGGGA